MEFRVKTTGQVLSSEEELRRWSKENNGPSWDRTTDEVLEVLGVEVVFEGPQATGGTIYQYSMRSGVERIDGKWFTKYILGPVFTNAAEELAYKQMKDAEFAKSARESRDNLLSECDWVVIKSIELGQSVPQSWSNYRQALRDLTKQNGFPTDINWPAKP